jgi:hypothetical protein
MFTACCPNANRLKPELQTAGNAWKLACSSAFRRSQARLCDLGNTPFRRDPHFHSNDPLKSIAISFENLMQMPL